MILTEMRFEWRDSLSLVAWAGILITKKITNRREGGLTCSDINKTVSDIWGDDRSRRRRSRFRDNRRVLHGTWRLATRVWSRGDRPPPLEERSITGYRGQPLGQHGRSLACSSNKIYPPRVFLGIISYWGSSIFQIDLCPSRVCSALPSIALIPSHRSFIYTPPFTDANHTPRSLRARPILLSWSTCRRILCSFLTSRFSIRATDSSIRTEGYQRGIYHH